MEKEKVLEIEFIKVWNKWAWKIINNKIPFSEFFTKVFYNDIGMYPKNKDSLFLEDVSGNYAEMISDNNLIDEKEKIQIESFVKFINEKYGIPKRWRAEVGERYFYIDAHGKVTNAKDTDNFFDIRLHDLGNYFKTETEAQKVKEKLYNFWSNVRGEIGGNE